MSDGLYFKNSWGPVWGCDQRWMPIKNGSLHHYIREKPIFWGGFERYIGERPTATRCGLKIYTLEKPTGEVTCMGCVAED